MSNSFSSTQSHAQVVCKCGKRARRRRSNTQENPGLFFYGCPDYSVKRGGGGCDFFRWENAETSGEQATNRQSRHDGEKVNYILEELLQEMKNFHKETIEEIKEIKHSARVVKGVFSVICVSVVVLFMALKM